MDTTPASSAVPLRIGDRFVETDSRPYTEADGTRGVHETTLLMEVTGISKVGFTYRRIDILAESGRPSFCGEPTTLGSMAWFGWFAAVDKGRVRCV